MKKVKATQNTAEKVVVPQKKIEDLTLDALKILRRDGIINRQGNTAASAAVETPSEGVFEDTPTEE
ncbi:hypothetical protein LCGC14_2834850 [marine sediment metagenome]|uniref:Uncharacterized protein n=1 Tax=marine sediment metagenome TaxID=412755 RepID=A0A0F9B3Z6_9ZZZZ